ncbi:hypothetical protein [Plantactinospora endophytica]|uniref:Uncharacterized protein n=1 Tax=Plantactinospora endophytica TaxID=673535 RepID=A0ABQ4E176_9ACTN|nr:hypothetical protein [Plantactinospora endophytica]GIG88461.1 hypothetical protein Pen02_33970 [Plantactinospora endophytica]
MGTVSFMGLKLSDPGVAQAILLPVVQSFVSSMTKTQSNFGTAAALPNLTGAAGTAQQDRRSIALNALQQVIGGVVGAQQTTSTGSAQLQASKAQLDAIVASAVAGGYQVLPTGQVTPSAWQRAYCKATWSHGGAARWAMYEMRAAQYTAQIAATTGQASTLDAQLTTALVKLATDYLSSLFQKDSDAGTTSVPALPDMPPLSPLPAPTIPAPVGSDLGGSTPRPLPTGVGVDLGAGAELTGTTALAGAGAGGPLGGAGALGAGPGGLGLSGASAGSPAVALPGGVAGVGMAGAAAAGAAGAAGAGRAGVGSSMMGVGGFGGHGGGAGDSGEHEVADWLVEDGEPFRSGDAPDGVIG